jgi:hypothetical protein
MIRDMYNMLRYIGDSLVNLLLPVRIRGDYAFEHGIVEAKVLHLKIKIIRYSMTIDNPTNRLHIQHRAQLHWVAGQAHRGLGANKAANCDPNLGLQGLARLVKDQMAENVIFIRWKNFGQLT